MQVSGAFWGRQNAAWQNTNAPGNTLLEKVQTIVSQQIDMKSANAVSKEMIAKIKQNNVETKTHTEDKSTSSVTDELARLEEDFYGELFLVRSQLRSLVDRKDEYSSILDGTADYEMALRNTYISSEDKERLGFTDFTTYLKANGYRKDRPSDSTDAVIDLDAFVENTNFQIGEPSTFTFDDFAAASSKNDIDVLMREDHMPLYEQWKTEQVEKLKTYAAEQLPEIQKQIDTFSERTYSIGTKYALKRAELLVEWSEDQGSDAVVNNLLEEMRSLEPSDGKAVLSLLGKIMARQREITIGLGGTANTGFEPIKNGRLDITV